MSFQKWTVSFQEEGQKLLFFLNQKLQEKFSARSLKKLIDEQACQINGRLERFATTLLRTGDEVTLRGIPSLFDTPFFKVERFRILFEDESLLVYNKPAGINSDELGILQLLQAYHPSLILVHRLDRDTTGALLFAKNLKIFDSFVHQFKQQKVFKQYQAIVDGVLQQEKGKIENRLAKKTFSAGKVRWGSVFFPEGLSALTEWQKVKSSQTATWITCWPRTGRTHQLRVHFAEKGHPILGDFHYSQKFICPYRPKRLLLHAEELLFDHPTQHFKIHIQVPLPEDFLKANQDLFK